jgi:hypothetical protein
MWPVLCISIDVRAVFLIYASDCGCHCFFRMAYALIDFYGTFRSSFLTVMYFYLPF